MGCIIAAHHVFHQPALDPVRVRPFLRRGRLYTDGHWFAGGRHASARPGSAGLRLIVCGRVRGLPPAAIAIFLVPLLSSLRAYVPSCLCAFFFP